MRPQCRVPGEAAGLLVPRAFLACWPTPRCLRSPSALAFLRNPSSLAPHPPAGNYDWKYLCTPQWPWCQANGGKRKPPRFFDKDAFLGFATALVSLRKAAPARAVTFKRVHEQQHGP